MSDKKSFLAEFKQFIARGNVLDMAVGVVVGAAFSAIVNSLVKDIVNLVIGLLTGGVDFGKLVIVLRAATEENPALTINYGNFINAIVNFLIIAFFVFCVVRTSNRLKEAAKEADRKKKAQEEKEAKAAASAKPPVVPEDIQLLREIRDSLRKQ